MAQASPSPNASGMLEAARLAAKQLGQVVAAADAYAPLARCLWLRALCRLFGSFFASLVILHRNVVPFVPLRSYIALLRASPVCRLVHPLMICRSKATTPVKVPPPIVTVPMRGVSVPAAIDSPQVQLRSAATAREAECVPK